MIVVDRSGSMRPHWNSVHNQLTHIVAKVPDRAWLHVEAFDGDMQRPTPVYSKHLDSEDARSFVAQRITNLPLPASHGHTDLGRAMTRAADVVDDIRLPVTILFWITDGKHEPDPNGKTLFPTINAPEFDVLAKRWGRIEHQTESSIYSFVIPIGSGGFEGAQLIKRIIPWTDFAADSITPGEIQQVISRMLAEAQADIVRTRAAREVRHPALTADLHLRPQPAGILRKRQASVRIRSSAQCVSYRISVLDTASAFLTPGDFGDAQVPIAP